MIKDALRKIIEGGMLTREEAREVMEEIMTGNATGAQFGALVTALRISSIDSPRAAAASGSAWTRIANFCAPYTET